jgi:lysophospholipase L1-like esterase
MKSNLSKILLLNSFSILLLIILELSCGFFYGTSRLDQIKEVLRESSTLFWHQRENLDTEFFGGKLTTDAYGFRKNSDQIYDSKHKILVLGASPSFGWGVDDNKTYSALLEKNIKKNGDKYSVVNGAGIGYSSFQGRRLLEEHFDRIRPSIVVISYVINDIDQFRFYQNNGLADNAVNTESKTILDLRNLLSNLNIYKLLQRTLIQVKGSRSIYNADPDSGLRVSMEDYRKNLAYMVEFIRERNAKVILMKVPVNIPIQKKEVDHDNIQISWAKKVVDRSYRYNKVLETLSVTKNTAFVDLSKIFSESNRYLFLDKSDTIHFNEDGHKLIAKALLGKFYEIK